MKERGVKQNQSLLQSGDWLAVWIGGFIFLLSLAPFVGSDLLGWSASTGVWTDITKSLAPIAKGSPLTGIVALLLTFAFLLVIMTVGAKLLGADVAKFAGSFTLIFWISYACWIAGHYAYIAATSDKLGQFGIAWSLNLTGEAGYIIALVLGLAIGNFFQGFAARIKEATRPEWYIKTAIVIMGAALGVKAAESLGLATAVIFRGLCAIIEAYLIYWAAVYFVARRWFGFSREWAAPLASGISICGVSAAIATGAAIRARPVVPIMVSSLVVIFAVVELLLLPFLAQTFLHNEPMVAGAWMGLAVKTDGAAIASGAITDALIRAKALEVGGIAYKEGWMLMATTTTKIFIDIFIGVWAFILALIWAGVIEKREGDKVCAIEIWHRFPKFVIGYVVTFLLLLIMCSANPDTIPTAKVGADEANVYRQLFFVLTFFCIGVVTDFRKLWEEGIGRLAAVYVVSLFGFVIWIGLAISWIFFHGMKPPLME
ncbi:MAG: putative sulfate exporter family transporter [Gammaproteobacteria bacterium]